MGPGRSTIGRGWPMVHLEDWMNIQELHQLGLSQRSATGSGSQDRPQVSAGATARISRAPSDRARWIPIATTCASGGSKVCTTRTSCFWKFRSADIREATHGFATCSRVGESKNGNELSCALRLRLASKASSTARLSARGIWNTALAPPCTPRLGLSRTIRKAILFFRSVPTCDAPIMINA